MSVKLVAEAGIGTVASGVAKANADVIQVHGLSSEFVTSPMLLLCFVTHSLSRMEDAWTG